MTMFRGMSEKASILVEERDVCEGHMLGGWSAKVSIPAGGELCCEGVSLEVDQQCEYTCTGE